MKVGSCELMIKCNCPIAVCVDDAYCPKIQTWHVNFSGIQLWGINCPIIEGVCGKMP